MNKNVKIIIAVVAIAVLAGAGYFALSQQKDERTFGERVADSAEELSEGVESAAGEFEDKSAAEQAGDAVEEAIDDATDGEPSAE